MVHGESTSVERGELHPLGTWIVDMVEDGKLSWLSRLQVYCIYIDLARVAPFLTWL
jgi:hypothetical protein